MAITGGGTGLTYRPDANYCNSQSGGSPDTFTYTLNGGSTATVSMTVTCVDDPPTAVNDSASIPEGDGATAIDVRGNDTDIDAGPKTINSVTQGAHGSVDITGSGTGLTYTLDDSYCNNTSRPPANPSDSFTYTLNGGSTGTRVGHDRPASTTVQSQSTTAPAVPGNSGPARLACSLTTPTSTAGRRRSRRSRPGPWTVTGTGGSTNAWTGSDTSPLPATAAPTASTTSSRRRRHATVSVDG